MSINSVPLSAGTTPKPKGKLRNTVVIWLLIIGMINYLDRSILSIAAPEMMNDLKFTATDIGLLGTAFSWAYAIGQLPTGWLIDKVGPKKMLGIGVIVWSFATFFGGLVSALWVFVLLRIILGVGEAPCFPSAAKITSKWYPKKERGLISGIWDSSTKWGPAIAPPILVFIMATFGWRELFYFAGLLGIVYGAVFLKFYHDPEKSKRLSKEEYEYIKQDDKAENLNDVSNINWFSLFKYRSVWGMILGYFCTIWTWNIFLVFLPLYLLDKFNVSFATLGLMASIPWIGGGLGNIIGGYTTKKMSESGKFSPMKAKQIVIAICAIMSAIAVVVIPFVDTLGLTVTLLTIALFFISSITGNAWALASDVAPSSMVASVGSIQNFGGYFGGAFSPIAAGIIVDVTGSYSLAFVSGGIIAGCAALFYFFVVKKPIKEAMA
ncbi:MFS transporter [Oceanobacillus timonensis]|uniref:MFS transporter n=1 Tax=Oceanobacillus timonensis TaxID=1926285 RepID=UPI0009BA92F2|nr:MFS transporter [Oceanobacillus timonensis]